MEEDVGVKVTRLRRRLSVEQSEDTSMVGSPAPATPTKKRGGRLAAKPQLELINENTPVSSPRKTRRKSLATDAEEKIITPSRRSARIKSNSSIVSDTLSVQATDSPRAKRAARRTSQAGSDNDGPATPARQTRRTRKDSASSVENQESGSISKPLPVAEMVIEEEPENDVQKAVNKSKSSPTTEESPNSARKSKRLSEKINRRSGSLKTDQDSSNCSAENKSLNISTTNEKNSAETEIQSNLKVNTSIVSKRSNADLSVSNTSLMNTHETESKGNQSNHDSASTLDISGLDKSKRNRTESWPVVTASDANESINYSDNEISKKRKGNSNRTFSATDNSLKTNKSNTSIHEINTSKSVLETTSKIKKLKSETNNEDAAITCEDIQVEVFTPKDNINDKKPDKSENTDITNDMAKLFENRPDNVQVSVYYEDSDSNSVGKETVNKNEKFDSEDQCVPEVHVVPNVEKTVLSNKVSDDNDKSASDISTTQVVNNDVNNSCEPMDIDETIHEEILQRSLQQPGSERQSLSSSQHNLTGETDNFKKNSSIPGSTEDTPDRSNKVKRKSSVSNTAVDTPDASKYDKRKSSMSNTDLDTPDESKNDKRNSSIPNIIIDSADRSKSGKRKSSISNTVVDTPDQSKNDKNTSEICNSAVGTPDQHKSNKRNSSISETPVNSPNQSKDIKRKSSISNSMPDTPDVSKNDNNKSTLILSQLKDVSNTSENVKSPKSAPINEVLSKSDFSEKINKKNPKGNHSLNDMKGTPKQSSIQKLTMQTSTPITILQNGIKTKIEEQKHDSAKKKKSNFSTSINETDSSEENSDDEPSGRRNMHLDDEAEEASDDYQSGDSQDEEERMYEAENEVVERGVTLTSDDDVSNDTDYEKDSFIVSSDPEDNDLLSGSGDDLSMSDKELSMSKKSKKKFNDRKLKEQKNASREMFESRHKLNTSDKKSPTKTKKNRMRIDSSLLESDEEIVRTKKPNRMRLDSTLETSVKVKETSVPEDGTAISTKRKNNKSMRDSIGNKSAIDEKEITIFNESTSDNADPLQIQLMKEPKTPQKDFNISVVQVQQEIESVHMTGSNSILDPTGTDPLEATMDPDDTSDSSESEEIMQNYDSVLNELNKEKRKIINKNISLNIGNKSKKNQAEPIIDQLNLTQVKKTTKNKNQLKEYTESKILIVSEKNNDSDNDSSNSIDLQLLFSEDNCGSDDEQLLQQNKTDDDNMFISLKKSSGKTNLQDSIDKLNVSKNVNTSTNESGMKKKKKHSLSEPPAEETQDNLNVSKNVNTSTNESGMKKKKKHSLSEPPAEETQNNFNVSKNLNTSTSESGIKKKKKHSLSEPPAEETQDEFGVLNAPAVYERKKKKKENKLDNVLCNTEQNDNLNVSKNVNTSTNESGMKKKKKHSLSEPPAEETQDNFNVSKNLNTSTSESGIKKKKKHSLSEPPAEETQDNLSVSKNLNTSMNESGMNKKKKLFSSELEAQGDLFFIDTTGTLQNNKENTVEELTAKTPKSQKKKKKHCISEPSLEENQGNTIAIAAITPKSEQKKKRHSTSEPSAEESQERTALTPKNEKKKKKHSLSEPSDKESQGDLFFIDTAGTLQNNKENTIEEPNAVKTPKSDKKKKKQKLETLVHDDDSDGAPDEAPYQSEKASEVDLRNTESVSESAETGTAKKKHKKKNKKSPASNQSGENIHTENITSQSKKRKRKSSNAESSREDAQEVVESGEVHEFVASNKKLKISHIKDNDTSGATETKKSKKNKKKNYDVNFQDTATTIEPTETQVKKNKKRKHRDEDGDNKKTKVSKDSSLQEVHVPRLPDNILRQLDDKPRNTDAAKVISTSNFIVENARQKRAKPSNYLEESIYLDQKSPLTKKEKPRIKKPKVLPFIPTASISDSGFTTNFRINKLTQFTTFEAEPVVFSKETYLQKKNIKRLGTYDKYKKQMHHKMSKF